MKKWLLVLGMITCMFSLTACSGEEAEPIMSEEEAQQYTDSIITALNSIDAQLAACEDDAARAEFKENYFKQLALSMDYEDFSFMENAIESWEKAKNELGAYQATTGYTYTFDEGEVVVNADIQGELRTGKVEVVLKEKNYVTNYSSVTTNINNTMGELMKNAALNTLLGMGTVFAVLILIAWVISLLKKIPAVIDKMGKKKTAPAPAAAAAPAAVPAAQAAEEDLTDDTELVAVIAAAIAASEGAASTDGFVVRSIRKANKSKWQRA